eukprot:8902070-Pyramimonas_sp.AAC.1
MLGRVIGRAPDLPGVHPGACEHLRSTLLEFTLDDGGTARPNVLYCLDDRCHRLLQRKQLLLGCLRGCLKELLGSKLVARHAL